MEPKITDHVTNRTKTKTELLRRYGGNHSPWREEVPRKEESVRWQRCVKQVGYKPRVKGVIRTMRVMNLQRKMIEDSVTYLERRRRA